MITRFDTVDTRPVLDDDARSLVPQHHRQRQRPIAVHDMPVTHADAGRLDLDTHLSRSRRLLLKIEDFAKAG